METTICLMNVYCELDQYSGKFSLTCINDNPEYFRIAIFEEGIKKKSRKVIDNEPIKICIDDNQKIMVVNEIDSTDFDYIINTDDVFQL